ncbi:MAG TPA: DUF2225 domain-containing protein [Spirochaetota bacterium]|nr:DUF2225 domain-containing protein [Spirochaetota bacterium]HOM37901.1 DUF2225 domain-containing protein [Spirochaetota bacterium]HPQ48705.1 DUF2225 domain-containing protein [Spirochaetota bacterium]
MEDKKKISFFSKNETTCPVCNYSFKREEMLTGRGRLIAKDITPELRRTYEENTKFGEVHPLAYFITVCPACWYASPQRDFNNISPNNIDLVSNLIEYRRKIIQEIFAPIIIDFEQERNLYSGAASYILSISCYSFFPPKESPTIKKGISSLRAAWLFGDMAAKVLKENKKELYERFLKIQEIMYEKARNYYNSAYDLALKGKEKLDGVDLGPDIDKNYGYDGFIYIMNYLNYKMSYKEEDIVKKAEIYREIKKTIGKIFGIGKASKEKPGPLLNIVRDLYDEVSSHLQEIEESVNLEIEE